MWYCASCNTEQDGDRLVHFANKHNINDNSTEDFGFWYHECVTNTICPDCRTNTEILVSMTEKGIRLDCMKCKTVFFYRKVQLERVIAK